ncbi:cysteine hydrolase family protein [Pseudonocardia spinosispora]|uniref:cysteine hydrolase family protein n=1 Tax=Pseudonocardia spinosispora TaxID=103441 RepID=UPI0004005F66|nr:isochorismatase family cysteine hydrolase [Pseudonocardia spinosispora]
MNTTALIVVDVQNGFCHPDGSLPTLGMPLADVDRAVTQSAAAVAQARELGIPVVFTRHVYRPGRADEGASLIGMVGNRLADVGGLAAGSWDGDVVDELGWTSEDLTVDKVRFDAFLWTSLDPLLRGLGVDQLLVCGVVTNICVESTVRAAFMRDYRVTVIGDACAAQTPRLHDIGLEVMGGIGLAEVVSLADGYRIGGLSEVAA